jgi:hypothetical protein
MFTSSRFPPVRRWLRQPPSHLGHLQWRWRVQSAGVVSGVMLLALAAAEPSAHAQRFAFSYTGSLVNFTVPINGIYQIIAFGAQGGGSVGGKGAEIGGNFNLTAGKLLRIAVGGAGTGRGGGGGSFVVGGNAPLVIAGAGGGPGHELGTPTPGGDGLTGPDGGSTCGLNGGTGGNGGGTCGLPPPGFPPSAAVAAADFSARAAARQAPAVVHSRILQEGALAVASAVAEEVSMVVAGVGAIAAVLAILAVE